VQAAGDGVGSSQGCDGGKGAAVLLLSSSLLSSSPLLIICHLHECGDAGCHSVVVGCGSAAWIVCLVQGIWEKECNGIGGVCNYHHHCWQ